MRKVSAYDLSNKRTSLLTWSPRTFEGCVKQVSRGCGDDSRRSYSVAVTESPTEMVPSLYHANVGLKAVVTVLGISDVNVAPELRTQNTNLAAHFA